MSDRCEDEKIVESRRRFIERCGKFAAVTPPLVAVMLAAANRNYAMAGSGFSPRGNNGFGNGGGDGIPGKSAGKGKHKIDDKDR